MHKIHSLYFVCSWSNNCERNIQIVNNFSKKKYLQVIIFVLKTTSSVLISLVDLFLNDIIIMILSLNRKPP